MPEVFGHLGWRHAQSRGRPFTGTVLIEETPALQSTLVSRLVYVIVAIYAITFATLSVLAHDSFNTHAFDLGNMDQAVWNTLHGRWFQFSNWEGGTTRLAAHVEPILIAIAQLYRIYSSPSTLLVFQAIVMSLGALPAFWLARDKLRSDFAGVVFASAYLLSPTLEAANLHDFHVVSLASSLLLFAFYFIHRRRYGLFLVFAILAMATKEQVPIGVALMGLYVALVQKRRLLGGFTTALAVAWFIVAFFIVIPHFNPAGASPYIGRYDQIGSSPKEIVANLFSHPGTAIANLSQPAKASYLMRVFAPVAFLSVFSITVVFVLPDLLLSLLSDFPAMYGFQAHYGAVMAPFVIISGIYGAAFLLRWCQRLFPKGGLVLLHGLSLLVLIFSLYGYYRVVFLPMSDHVPVVTDHDRLAKSFIKTIPGDAAVSALSVLNPHVSQRQRLYLFPDVRDADYIFLDVTSTPAPIDTPSLEWRVRLMLQDQKREWGVAAAKDGYMLLKRGEANASIPQEFYSFVSAKPSDADHKAPVTFGDSLRLLGYDVHPDGATLHGEDPYASVTLYWQTAAPLEKNYLIALYLTDSAGRVFNVQTYDPTTVWYPTSKWKPGETLRTEFLRLPMAERKYGEVWLAVIDGKDTKDATLRLTPAAEGKLTADGDRRLVKLLELRAD